MLIGGKPLGNVCLVPRLEPRLGGVGRGLSRDSSLEQRGTKMSECVRFTTTTTTSTLAAFVFNEISGLETHIVNMFMIRP